MTFWESGEHIDHGYFRRGDGQHPEHLVVFLHGWRDNYRECYTELTEALLKHVPDLPDALCFGYPAALNEAASIEGAAARLLHFLTSPSCAKYRHLILIAHSTGGLVIKRAFVDTYYQSIVAQGAPVTQNNLLARTRCIINLSVPHDGAHRVLKVLFPLAVPAIYAAGGIFGVMNYFQGVLGSAPRYHRGLNRITIQLAWRTSRLRRLGAQFNKLIDTLRMAHAPHPAVLDYVGRNDKAILRSEIEAAASNAATNGQLTNATTDATRPKPELEGSSWGSARALEAERNAMEGSALHEFDGHHSGFKVPESENDSIVVTIANAIRKRLNDTVMMLSDRTYWEIASVEQRAGIAALTSQQEEAVVDVANLMKAEPIGGQSIVVTGVAGSGKSACVRRIAATVAARVLSGGVQKGALMVPLYRYKGTADFNEIVSWWCNESAHDASSKLLIRSGVSEAEIPHDYIARALNPSALHTALSQGDLDVLLDGMDDYVSHNAHVDDTTALRMLDEIVGTYKTADLSLVLGIRDSMILHLYEDFATIRRIGVMSMLELSRLILHDDDELIALYNKLLEDIPADRKYVRDLLMTPLFARGLGERDTLRQLAETKLTEARLFEAILVQYIRHSRLPDPHFSISNLATALKLVGHIWYSHWCSNVELTEIQQALAHHLANWEMVRESLPADLARDIDKAVELVLDTEKLDALLSRTVFTKSTGYSPVHREWETFLASGYIALAVDAENSYELSHRAAGWRMHHLIGEMYDTEDQARLAAGKPVKEFSAEFVRQTIEHAVEIGLTSGDQSAQIPLGNLVGVVGHSNRAIGSEAINVICDKCILARDSPPLVKLFAIQTLAYRCIRNDQRDDYRDDIAKSLRTALDRLLQSETRADHYVRYVARLVRDYVIGDAPLVKAPIGDSWEGDFRPDEGIYEDAMAMVLHKEGRHYKKTSFEKAVQAMMVDMLAEAIRYPDKIFACVTYAVCLVAARRHNGDEPGVRQALNAAFDRETETGRRLYEILAAEERFPFLLMIWDKLDVDNVTKDATMQLETFHSLHVNESHA